MNFVTHDELTQFLKTFRSITGWTTGDLAEATGLSTATLRRVMNSDQYMDLRSYETLMTFFHETFFHEKFNKKGQ